MTPKMFVECGVWSKIRVRVKLLTSRVVDSHAIIPVYLAAYCKVRKTKFTSFPNNCKGKARAVFKLYRGVRSHLTKDL